MFYANTKHFYIRDLSICEFWYLQKDPATNFLQMLRDNCTTYNKLAESH